MAAIYIYKYITNSLEITDANGELLIKILIIMYQNFIPFNNLSALMIKIQVALVNICKFAKQ